MAKKTFEERFKTAQVHIQNKDSKKALYQLEKCLDDYPLESKENEVQAMIDGLETEDSVVSSDKVVEFVVTAPFYSNGNCYEVGQKLMLKEKNDFVHVKLVE